MSISFTSNSTVSQFQHESLPSMNFRQGQASPITQTLTYAATINWNVQNGQVAKVTLTAGAATVANPTNLTNDTYYSIEIIQPSSGTGTLSWGSLFRFAYNAAPSLSVGGSLRDVITFKYDGTTLYEVGRSMGLPTV